MLRSQAVQPAVILNANAGATRRNPRLPERLSRSLRGRGELYVTSSLADLEATARSLAARQVRHIGVVGGDGTTSTTLTALWRAYGAQPLPTIAFLRGGTMNTVAHSLGTSRGSTSELLRRALRVWSGERRARLVERPALQIGERLGFLFGTGIMYGYLAEYYEVGHGRPTPLTALQVFSKSLMSALVNGRTYARILQDDDLEIRYEGGTWESYKYLTVGAGTVEQVGLGFRPFHRCSEEDQRFHLLAIKGRPYQIAGDLPSIWLGRGMRQKTAYETVTGWAELRSSRNTFGYFVDGDLHTAGSSLRLQVGPHFRILCI